MEKSEMLWIASKYVTKGYSKEQMRNGDACYKLKGEEGNNIKDKIAEYMEELQDIGRIAFYEKYKDYKLYHNGFELSSYYRKKNKLYYGKIEIEDTCEPYMYNTYDDLNKIEIGDILTLKFGKKTFGIIEVREEYVGKKLKFIVNNYIEYNFRRKTRRLALIPINKVQNYNDSDVLILDDADRFECLMIDLFPVNAMPYYGWENKTVKIIAVE